MRRTGTKSPVKLDAFDMTIFFSFVFLSMITIFVYQYHIDDLIWVDMPNHFFGGLLIGAILVRSRISNLKIFLLLTFFFISGWEALEMILQYYNIDGPLFDETYLNKTLDIVMGLLGVAAYSAPWSWGRKQVYFLPREEICDRLEKKINAYLNYMKL